MSVASKENEAQVSKVLVLVIFNLLDPVDKFHD